MSVVRRVFFEVKLPSYGRVQDVWYSLLQHLDGSSMNHFGLCSITISGACNCVHEFPEHDIADSCFVHSTFSDWTIPSIFNVRCSPSSSSDSIMFRTWSNGIHPICVHNLDSALVIGHCACFGTAVQRNTLITDQNVHAKKCTNRVSYRSAVDLLQRLVHQQTRLGP